MAPISARSPYGTLKILALLFSAALVAYIYKLSQLTHVEILWRDYPFLQFGSTVLGFAFMLVFCNLILKNTIFSYSTVTRYISTYSEIWLFSLSMFCAIFKISFHKFAVILFTFLLVFIVIGIVLRATKDLKSDFSKNLFYLSLLLTVNLFLLRPFSPINRNNIFFSMTGRLDALQPFESLFRATTSHGDLLGTLDQTSNLGGLPYYPFSQSELFNFVAFLFNVDGGNSIEFFNIFKLIIFTFFTFGMAGAFFMLRAGFGLSAVTSVIGAIIYFYGNSAFIGYLGNENYHHLSEYVIFPWAVLCVVLGIRVSKNKALIILGGFLLGCANYLMRSAFEFTAISALSLLLFAGYIQALSKSYPKINWPVTRDILEVIFYVAIGFALGSSLFLATLLGNLYESNIAIIQPHNFFGLPWKSPLVEWTSIFFKFKFNTEYPQAPEDVGQHVGFFKGPIISFIILYSLFSAIRSYSKNPKNVLVLKPIVTFALIFLFLLFIQLGEESYFSYLMTYFKYGRVHFSTRLLVYFHFFVGVAAVFVFEELIIKKKLDKTVFLLCLIIYVATELFIQLPKHNFAYIIYELGLLLLFTIFLSWYYIQSKAYILLAFPAIFLLNCYYQSDITPILLNNNQSFKDFHFNSITTPPTSLNVCKNANEQCAQVVKNEVIQLRNLNPAIHKKCLQSIGGIDRFSINPICQKLNSPIQKLVGANYDRHLYVFSKDLPQFSNGLNGVDVSDSSVFSYGGSPVFPSVRATYLLGALFGFREDMLAIPYKFDSSRLLDLKIRSLINILGIRFLIIEATDANRSRLSALKEYFDLIYDDGESYILFNRNARPFVYLASRTVQSALDTIHLVKEFPFSPFHTSTTKEAISKISAGDSLVYNALADLGSGSDVSIDNGQDFINYQPRTHSSHDFVDILGMAGTRLALKVNCSEKCLLVINNVMLNGWHAFSSIGELRLLPVNFGLIGVEIPSAYSGLIYIEYSDGYREFGLFVLCAAFIWILLGLRSCSVNGGGSPVKNTEGH